MNLYAGTMLVAVGAALFAAAPATYAHGTATPSAVVFENVRIFDGKSDRLSEPVFGLKRGIDSGLVPGPRIWPSGAFISQTGGHGDFRLPNELPSPSGGLSFSERVGAAAIADSPDAVRQRVREQLALGASRVKPMAGGGVSSMFDPLDVTQYTAAELLLVDGNPLEDIGLMADPARNFLVIMKDGKIDKNHLQ